MGMQLKKYEVKIIAPDGMDRWADVTAYSRAEAAEIIRKEYPVLDYGRYTMKFTNTTILED